MKKAHHSVQSLLLFLLFIASTSLADQGLPANLQVDIIFPRENETYKPTQWFPVVVAVQNANAVWPQALDINIWIRGSQWSRKMGWPETLGPDMFEIEDAVTATPGQTLFYYMASNITNATTDTFLLTWEFGFQNTCQANMSSPVDLYDDGVIPWYTRPGGDPDALNNFTFHTAPEGKIPDMEDAVSRCADLNQTNINGAFITGNKTVLHPCYDDWPCPVIERGTISTTCQYKSKAKEVADEVEALMLKKMKCEEGTWQTIKAPCPNSDAALSRGGHSLASWIGVAVVLYAFNLV
ncbi:hypothetical protein F5X68DRAFT_190337 [Plectosphaerella plurivora]|uniref:DUF7136 domain-containing protein n=1 Tax=Plectosphaerella plurivora TaxID=936078 RepID=A0A9P9AC63_9PEZI|nr:hypothetical protein F5X68DRAFT_190337 [Plectosphaerella plurivora]